ncbi:hypothetical protein VNO78_00487 [Psophocarpus tetragonolobus]|uniref:Uncharacterized protein n=1 Tax=Psophocarpus tetragonolobus TaxID=3891 RepID=A0AAN9SYI3_PSOTE
MLEFHNIMAYSKLGLMVSGIFVSLMIFHGTFSAQGRPLKLEMKQQLITHQNTIGEMAKVAEYTATWHPHIKYPQYDDGAGNWTVHDFQPTDPGHSPGAGHSSPHANVVSKP